MRKILLIILIIFSTQSFAMKNVWQLKGGVTFATGKAKTINEERGKSNDNFEEKYESHFWGAGFNTHFGKRFDRSEFTLSSYVFISRLDRLHFQTGTTEVTGSGSQRSVGFAPLYKYNFVRYDYETWTPYLSAGPVWALQTISLDNYQIISGNYNKDYKLVVSSRGGVIAVGVEENLPFKEMHPVYIEVAYTYLRAYRSGIIDASNYSEVQTLNEDEIGHYVSGHIVMLSMGITIF